jgi:flagellar hook-associated protein 3 FlgL
MALRGGLEGTRQYQRNIDDATGWQETTEQALASITDSIQRAKELLVEGASDTADATSRAAIANEIDQIIAGVKQDGNASYRGAFLFGGSLIDQPPYTAGADDTYKGDDAGLDPLVPGVIREIGPGVTMSINTVGREVLGDGQGVGDGKLLDVLRDAAQNLRSGAGATIRSSDLPRLEGSLDKVLEVRARNGARSNRLDAANSRLDQVEETTVTQLSKTEDADLAKTLIELNSQTVAYQAALKAGANIMQASLMDFLR